LVSPGRLEIIPLGGLGEFGMNMMLYRQGDDCVLVDAGMMFPGSEHLGVDVVIPDLAFLEDCGTIHGVLLTHGHEDHIGALPFVLGRHDVPVYAAPYTAGLVQRRLREHELDGHVRIQDLPGDDEELRLGQFGVRTVPVAHSIPQAAMLVLRTAVGLVVHTADFKLDPDPPDGRGTDLDRLAELGREGVVALLSDSTNADVAGMTPSERTVRPGLSTCIGGARGRVLVTTFSSNILRIQQVIDVAREHGRRVALVGTSIRAQVEVAESLGLLRYPADVRCDPDRAMNLPRDEALLIVTGSQGEPLSALARISVDNHREAHVDEGDLVLHSARKIPGNEVGIQRMFNHLLRRGADVVTASHAPIHVSGHPAREELRLLIHLLRPRHVIPIHGEYGQLLAHARLARSAGLADDAVVLAESGDVVALDETGCRVVDRVPVGQVFIDGALDEIEPVVLRERRRAAYDGTVVAVVAIGRGEGGQLRPPEIVARGLVGEDDSPAVLDDAARSVSRALRAMSAEERGDEGVLRARLQSELKRFFRRRLQRRPMIIPVIVEY
jgi:ribonuclease J